MKFETVVACVGQKRDPTYLLTDLLLFVVVVVVKRLGLVVFVKRGGEILHIRGLTSTFFE